MNVVGRKGRRRLLLLGAALAVLFSASQSGAQAVNDDAKAVRDGIASFAQTTRALAGHGLLADAVALTGVDPSGPAGLNLDQLLAQALALPDSFESLDPMNNPGSVRSAIEGLDASPLTVGGVSVQIGCPGSGTDCATPVTAAVSEGRLRLGIPVLAQRTVSTPVALPTNLADFSGGSLDIALEAQTTLPFVYDPALRTTTPGAPQVAFALDAPEGSLPQLDLTATLQSTGTTLSATLGFTDVTVGLSDLLGNLNLGVQLQDPDSDGRITQDELANTAIGDLTTLSRSGTVSGQLTLDSSLVRPSNPDVTQPFSSTLDDETGFSFPSISPGALNPFSTVTPETVINAFGQAAAALAGSHVAADQSLPFLDGGLSRAFDVAQPLFDFVSKQGVVCTTVPDAGGDLTRLEAGDRVACHAFVIHRPEQQVEDVFWRVPAGAPIETVDNSEPTESAGTVGMQPTKHATFRMTGDGAFNVTADYRLVPKPGIDNPPPSESRTTERPAASAQQLLDKLRQLGGFTELSNDEALAYDPDTKALRFRLKKTFDPAGRELAYDFGDQLEQGSGLVGLQLNNAARMDVNVSNVALDVTVGVLLVDDLNTIGEHQSCPEPPADPSNPPPCPKTELDRFFVEVDPAAGQHELEVGDAAFTAGAPHLVGRLGFLSVENVPAATTLSIRKPNDSTDPVVAVDVAPPDIGTTGQTGMNVGSTNLPNAIRLRELLFQLPDLVSATPLNLEMAGSLQVKAMAGTTELGRGTVTIDWDDVSVGRPTVTADTAFGEQLRRLDLDPNLFGTASGASAEEPDGTDTLRVVTGTAAFPAQDPDAPAQDGTKLVGKRLENLTDGSFCDVTGASATSATCALAGGTDNRWDDGDEYRIRVGDPLAMLYLLLDNLEQVVAGLDTLSGGAAGPVFESDLPLVGVSPKDLLSQLQSIRRAGTELRGAPTGAIVCGTERVRRTDGTLVEPPQVTGDPSDLGGPGSILCSITSAKPATSVRWTALQGATVIEGSTLPSTVGQPATSLVTVAVSHPQGKIASAELPGGYRLKATFTDADGEHVLHFPEIAVPPTLQSFEKAIEDKLGIGNALTLGVQPAAGDQPRRITIGLTYGICTVASLCPGEAVDASRRFASPINIELGVKDLVGVGAAADVAVDYRALAKLDLAVALSESPSIQVLPTTALELKGRFETSAVNLTANFGPFGMLAGQHARTGDTGNTGAGELKLGADFRLRGPDTPSSPDAFLGGLNASFSDPEGADPVECGTIVDNSDQEQSLSGIACGRLSLGLQGASDPYLGDIGFEISGIQPDGSLTFGQTIIQDDITTNLAGKVMSWSSLLRAMPYLLERLEEGLSAGGSRAAESAGGKKIPIVGDALDAGADVVNKFRTQVVEPTVEPIGTAITAAEDATVGTVKEQIRTFLFTTLGPGEGGQNLLLKRDSAPASETEVTANDVIVSVQCGPACIDGATTAAAITDVNVVMNIGQKATTGSVPFDIGLDGLPLNVAANVQAVADWKVRVDVGVNKDTGPYLGVGDNSTPKEAVVSATVLLGDELADPGPAGAICERSVADPASDSATTTATGGFVAAANRCLTGQLGFIGVNVRDHVGSDSVFNETNKRSRLRLETTLDLKRKGGGTTRLPLTELLSDKLEPHVGIDLDALMNLRVRTGIPENQVAGFPSVLGTFQLAWKFARSTDATVPTVDTPLRVEFNHLHLDAGAFLTKYLKPTLDEVRKVTSPFAPVVETLNAPLPVVSDLAAMIGQPPLTLLGLMEKVSDNNLSVIKSLASFIELANSNLTASGLIPLGTASNGGAFAVDARKAQSEASPTTAAQLVQPKEGGKGDNLLAKSGGSMGTKAGESGAGKTKDELPGTFGVPGLTFPFMNDAGQVFGLLMGQDVTLVRYDVGRLQATAGFSYNFGPFFIGPVPVTAGIGGSATLAGRFALGYDTSGIRKVLSGGTGTYLFDGIFIDDVDAAGFDVPEISLIGEVYARAGVTVFVATAGIEGGIRMTVDLNLNDKPEPDGKLRIEEVFNKLSNPMCLFDVSGKLEAFLRAFLEINYFVGTEKWDWEILRVTLLEFAGECTPPTPVLADLAGPVGNKTLTLNMGSAARREARQINPTDIHEKYVVRPVDNAGRYAVSAFGVYQVYGPGIARIVADAGDGDDVILLEPGTNQNTGGGTPIPFRASSIITGGDGNDTISGGSGVDRITGGDGNDKIDGHGGNDILSGAGDNDTMSGGQGRDEITGGTGTDRLSGGPGVDTIDGGPHDDFINGGPGTNPDDSSTTTESRDGGDFLTGGTGRDMIEGGWGNDTVYGDLTLTGTLAANCATDGASAEADRDSIDGGPGDDTLFGGGGPDTVVGGGGADKLCGNGGNDTLDGDSPELASGLLAGNDFLDGGLGDDVLLGRAGDDVLRGQGGADHLIGGDGNDDLVGGSGRDLLEGGGGGRDVLVGDAGTITGSSESGAAARPAGSQALGALVTVVSTGLDSTPAACSYTRHETSARTAGFSDCLIGGEGGDALFGEAGRDTMTGLGGEDWMAGGDDNDTMRGGDLTDDMYGDDGNDEMHGDSGDDRMFGGRHQDLMRGGIGVDTMFGEGGADEMFGDAADDLMVGGSAAAGSEDAEVDLGGGIGTVGDRMYGGAGSDTMAGDNAITVDGDVTLFDVGTTGFTPAAGTSGGDRMFGDEAADRIWGQGGDDTLSGGAGADLIQGNAGADTLHGDGAADLLVGGTTPHATLKAGADTVGFGIALDGGDTLNGGPNDDIALGDNVDINAAGEAVFHSPADPGTYGIDTIKGDDGDDRIWGQLDGDFLYGNAGHDYVLGDLGTITPAADPLGFWPGGAPDYDVLLVEPDNGGADVVDGDNGNDHLFGGAAADTMQGGLGDDYLEGNGGSDTMFGLSSTADNSVLHEMGFGLATDQDDLIGGSSSWTRPGDGARADEGEVGMSGNAEQDVMSGDNADIERLVASPGQWAIDPITQGRARTVTLLDREKTGTDLEAVSGGDTMFGNAGNDRMYGEGGADRMKGNANDDYLEGNQDTDWVEGNLGEDDIIGGSSFELADTPGAGDPDGSDFLFGGGDADVVTGDNAVVVRDPAAVGDPLYFATQNRFLGYTSPRWIRLLDLAAPAVGTRFGDDLISGGSGGDIGLGQDGNDWISGGTDEDYLEGNGGTDRMYGDRSHTDDGVEGVPAIPADFASFASAPVELLGPSTPHGQDDMLGGSALEEHRDSNDFQYGDGAADVLLGDNGTLTRTITGAAYAIYAERYPIGSPPAGASYLRMPVRFDVAGPAGTSGGDHQEGNDGDDTLYGQDGDDRQWGNAGNDDMYGELGADRMFGGTGEDAMVGDRGAIVSRLIDGSPGDPTQLSIKTKSVPMFDYTTFRNGMLDRRVSLTHDVHPAGDRFGAALQSPGLTEGSGDFMRGGPDHDSLHGAFGDDLMNGDSGGDFLFGSDGSDVMYGGRGNPDPLNQSDRGTNDAFLDYLFGGHGGDPALDQGIVTGGADMLDYRPREQDPDAWKMLVAPYDDEPLNQHSQGIDWIYGGWDRDVMQADVADLGPNPGDRLVDWTGSYNLYTHCPADNGGFNDIRQMSPEMLDFLEKLAYGSGAGRSLEEVRTSGTSGYRELALVHRADINDNSGKAYPTTPGHFDAYSCTP